MNHAATEKVSKGDAALEEKVRRRNELENGNIQHIALNDTTQLAELCMSTGIKGGLAQKEHNLMNCNRLPL